MSTHLTPTDSEVEKLPRELVLHLAGLVNLSLDDDEIELLRSQFAETIDYVKNLDELDTEGVEPMAHTTGDMNLSFEDGTPSDRTFTLEEATSNGAKVSDGEFEVSKIIDK